MGLHLMVPLGLDYLKLPEILVPSRLTVIVDCSAMVLPLYLDSVACSHPDRIVACFRADWEILVDSETVDLEIVGLETVGLGTVGLDNFDYRIGLGTVDWDIDLGTVDSQTDLDIVRDDDARDGGGEDNWYLGIDCCQSFDLVRKIADLGKVVAEIVVVGKVVVEIVAVGKVSVGIVAVGMVAEGKLDYLDNRTYFGDIDLEIHRID